MKSKKYTADELQRRISQVLQTDINDNSQLGNLGVRELLEELNIYQQELEYQNDELRRSQVSLESARAYAFDLFEGAPVAYVVLDDAFRIRRMNKMFKSYFGQKMLEWGDAPDFRKLLRNNDQDLFHQFVYAREGSAENGLTLQVGGRYCFIRLDLRDLDGASEWRLSLTDVHNEHLALAALARSERRLRSLINTAPDVIFTMRTGTGAITFVSDRAEQLAGNKAVSYIGGTFPSFVSSEDQAVAETFLADLSQIGTEDIIREVELRFMNREGHLGWTQVVGKKVVGDDKDQDYILCILRPIEHQVQQRLEVEAQNQRLKSFAYIISHNISSYVANVDGLVQLITAEELSNEEAKELYGPLRNSSANLLDAIRHLNEILKIQKSTGIGKVSLNLKSEVIKVLSTLQGQLESSKLEVVVDIPDTLEVCFHPAYLQSILLNFCTNAIRYRRTDIPNAYFNISAVLKADKSVEIEFTDNGQGMDMHVAGKKLFGMYQTFHQHPESKGLGLFMVKHQLDAMGSTIQVKSEVNVGTTFTIHVPDCEHHHVEAL